MPATCMALSPVNHMLCRIGGRESASDANASSFFMEMSDVASMTGVASARDLVLLDEVGKATSTDDGSCLAWAIAEHASRAAQGIKEFLPARCLCLGLYPFAVCLFACIATCWLASSQALTFVCELVRAHV